MNHENFRFAPPYENSPNSSVWRASCDKEKDRPNICYFVLNYSQVAEQDIGCSRRILNKCFINTLLMDPFVSTICHAPIIFYSLVTCIVHYLS